MLPFILGGVAIAATGYGIKKFFSDESNLDKIDDALMKGIDWLDSVDQKTEGFFDGLIQKIDDAKNQEKLTSLLDELDDIKNTTATIIYNDIEELFFYATENSCSDIYLPCEIKLIKQPSFKYTEENYQIIEKFCNILTTTNAFLTQHIDDIKASSTQSLSTGRLYALSQTQTEKLYKLQTSLENIIYSPLSVDNVTISIVAKRSFNRIERTIEMFKTND